MCIRDRDWVVEKGKSAGKALHKAADRDGDGQLGIGDVLTGIGEVKDFAGEKIAQAGKAMGLSLIHISDSFLRRPELPAAAYAWCSPPPPTQPSC